MEKEKELLIKICKAYLFDERLTLSNNIDYIKLYKLAKVQNLLPLCFCVLSSANNKENVPADIYKKFQDSLFDSVFLYQTQCDVLKEFETLLQSAEIKYTVFKGARLRELYKNPEVRLMGDIDAYTDISNRDAVKKLLCDNGFNCKAENGPVFEYTKNDVLIEMHTDLLSDYDKKIGEILANATYDGCVGSIGCDDMMIYLIAHIAHHFNFHGAGVRMIFDLAVLQKSSKIDFDKVFAVLDEVSLDLFAKVILSICCKWFGVGTSYDVKTSGAEEFLLSYGAFGMNNRNDGAVAIRKGLQNNTSSKFKIKMRLAFPSYEKLKEIPYIKFIDGRKYLVPAAWVYRLFYNLKYRKKYLTNTLDNIDDEALTKAQEEMQLFKEIGL